MATIKIYGDNRYSVERKPFPGKDLRGAAGLGSPLNDPLAEELANSPGFTGDTIVTLSPNKDRSATASKTEFYLVIDSPSDPGEHSVILLNQNGRYSWHFEQEISLERSTGGTAGTSRKFVIPAPPEGVGDRSSGSTRAYNPVTFQRYAGALTEAAKAYIFKVTGKTADWLIEKNESKINPGIVPISFNFGDYRLPALSPEEWTGSSDWARDCPIGFKPRRVLLLVHGTFSSTKGSFYHIPRDFFLDAINEYDVILGFDHFTLSEDPQSNARLLEAELKTMGDWWPDASIDAIAFSRGGLVLRYLIEKLAPPEFRFGKVIFVGCTNGGTLLAKPENFKELLDLHTNLISSGFKVGGLANRLSSHIKLGDLISGLAGFANMIAHHVSEIPGIMAMAPDSDLIMELNGTPANSNASLPEYHVISSDFEPDESSDPDSLAGKIALSVTHPISRKVFGETQNDLVVNVSSMADFDDVREGALSESRKFGFGTNPFIFHTVYFAHPKTDRKLREWLGIEESANSVATRTARDFDRSGRGTPGKDEEFIHRFLHFSNGSNGTNGSHSSVKAHQDPTVEAAVTSVHKFAINFQVEWNDVRNSNAEYEDGSAIYAVGHYIGVPPQRAQKALDEVVTCPGKCPENGEGVFEKQFNHGALDGKTGRIQLFPWARNPIPGRMVALSGMGCPGGFDIEKSRTLYRNLFNLVNELPNYNSVATVMIGAGEGSLKYEDSVEGLLLGLSDAIASHENPNLRHVRIVEISKHKAIIIHDCLRRLLKQNYPSFEVKGEVKLSMPEDTRGRIEICHNQAYVLKELLKSGPEKLRELIPVQGNREGFDETMESFASWFNQPKDLEVIIAEKAVEISQISARDDSDDIPVTRIFVVSNEGKTYRVSAITDNATIPERLVNVGEDIIEEIVDCIANFSFTECGDKGNPSFEKAIGEFGDLCELLSAKMLPAEFRALVRKSQCLTFVVDESTAKIPWELLADNGGNPGDRQHKALHYPVSRQLRTLNSPVVQMRPVSQGKRRALVIGDPCSNLPAAADEAVKVAKKLDSCGLEVSCLIGPNQATRPKILQLLNKYSFDLIHFAGHANFDRDTPNRESGWVFQNGLLTAGALHDVCSLPPIIFANACQSANMHAKSTHLVSSLAAQFFQIGVRHYIGTAWNVNDYGAASFAEEFYDHFIRPENEVDTDVCDIGEALVKARKRVMSEEGERLWAAYQHYGIPTYKWEFG